MDVVWWSLGIVAFVAVIVLGWKLQRLADEVPDRKSTLTDEERAQAQLGIALTSSTTYTSH